MLHILWLIFKIIGILLLIILGLLMLTGLAVLFAPARYQLEAKTEDGIEKAVVRLRAFWFLHLISAVIDYRQKKFSWQVRVGWKKFNEQSKPQQNSRYEADEEECDKQEETLRENKQESDERVSSETNCSKESDKKQTEKPQKISWVEKIKCTIRKICDKIKALWSAKEKVVDFLTDETHQNAFQKVKKEVVVLAKHLRPRTLKGFVRFGFEDPYHTGQTLAILSVLYPFYGDRIEISPEFDRKVLEGDIYIKGHMRGIHMLVLVFRLLLDGNIRRTIKDIKSFK